MKKYMKHVMAAVLAAALFLTGCQSTLKPAMDMEYARNTVAELDLSELFNEEDGYHYRDVKWGYNMTQANGAMYNSIKEVNAYGSDGSVTYSMNALNITLNGNKPTECLVTENKEGNVQSVAYMFSYSGKNAQNMNDENRVDQNAFFNDYYEVMKAKFGEPQDIYDNDRDLGTGAMAHYVIYTWEYVTADGKTTELQWTAAYLNGAEVPSYLSLITVWAEAMLQEEAAE